MSATEPAVKNPKVFCSHRSVDKPRVREIARKLRGADIDAWFDEWEIKPGDDVVAAINDGLASYDVGLIFFSNEIEEGKWIQAEKMYPASSGESISGHSMMMRACLSLLIPTVVEDLVTSQVFRHVV
jgi:TIR domain